MELDNNQFELEAPDHSLLDSPRPSVIGRLFRLMIIVLVCSAIGYGGFVAFDIGGGEEDEESTETTIHTVARENFEAFVTESGDIESSNNVEIRCEVKSEGRSTTIIDIVEEGTKVKQGDFLIQFDDSVIKQNLTQMEIVVAVDEKAVIEAEAELEKAKQTLEEYRDGLYLVEQETFESELFQAESRLKSAQDVLTHSERMFRKGFVTQTQLEADQLNVETAKRAANASKTKLNVLQKFTLKKKTNEYEAEIEKHEATVKAAKFTLKLSQQRRDEIKAQVDKCHVVAPSDGQVVYANDFQRSQKVVIEEGAQIREGQIVIRLPNQSKMQVNARINDSKIKQVKVGNPVKVELDVSPDTPVDGVVTKVNQFPFPRQWYGGPIEYGAEITITTPPPQLTPGQRAKVRIFVEEQKDVLTLPIQSVIEKSGSHYCLVRNQQDEWVTRKVDIGSNNGSFVIVNEGVTEGEVVATTVDLLWDDVQRRTNREMQKEKVSSAKVADSRP